MPKEHKQKKVVIVEKKSAKKKKRVTGVVKGHGDFFTDMLGGGVNLLGGLAKDVVDMGANTLGGWLSGRGKYDYVKNTTMKRIGSATDPPAFRPGADGSAMISHREYIGDIYVANANTFQLNLSQQSINPSNPVLFPWLSQIANSYEQWQPEGIVFEFKSLSGDAVSSTNASLGAVMLSTQYDPYDPAFVNKTAMLEYQFTTDEKPSSTFLHPVECARKETADVLLDVSQNGADIREFELGAFTVATSGMQAAETAGELWVTYDIKFLKPKNAGATQGGQSVSHWNGTINASNAPAITASTVNVVNNPVGATLTLVNAGSGILNWTTVLPQGATGDFVWVFVTGQGALSTTTAGGWGGATPTNCTANSNEFDLGTSAAIATTVGSNSPSMRVQSYTVTPTQAATGVAKYVQAQAASTVSSTDSWAYDVFLLDLGQVNVGFSRVPIWRRLAELESRMAQNTLLIAEEEARPGAPAATSSTLQSSTCTSAPPVVPIPAVGLRRRA